jgi:hypothetical protein
MAFLAIGLLLHLERSAYALHGYRRELTVREGLNGLVRYAAIPTQGKIEGFREKSKSAESRVEREAYEELAEVAAALAVRDAKLCEAAVAQFQREAADHRRVDEAQAAATEQAAAAAQAQTAKQELRAKLRQALSTARREIPVANAIDVGGASLATLPEASLVDQKWQALRDFGKRVRQQGSSANMLTLLTGVSGVKTVAGATFDVKLEGSERDGHFDVLSHLNGAVGHVADGLSFDASLDGLMAAFFLRVALPGCLAWGHGYYDRDQQLIFTDEQAVSALVAERVSPDSAGLQAGPALWPRRRRNANDAVPGIPPRKRLIRLRRQRGQWTGLCHP